MRLALLKKCANIKHFSEILVFLLISVSLFSCETTEPLFDHFTPAGTYSLNWNDLPVIDESKDIRLGGFVGLFYKGDRLFYTVTDRGPRLEQSNTTGFDEYFLKETFTPQVVALELQDDQSIKVTNQVPIYNPLGERTTGFPPQNVWSTDETVLNSDKKSDPWGVFPGGIYLDIPNHFFWFADQYGPSLMRMEVDGMWSTRLRPSEGLRLALGNHTVGGGFSGIDFDSHGRLIAVTGRCLENNRNPSDTSDSQINFRIRRVIQYDFDKNSDISMFYFVEPNSFDGLNERFASLGDIEVVNDTSFLITEFGYHEGAERNLLYLASINDTTSKTESGLEGILGKTFETLTEGEWRANNLTALKKVLLMDLSATGIKRPEGIAILDKSRIALIDNNNYGITEADPVGRSYRLEKNPIKLEIVTLPFELDIKN